MSGDRSAKGPSDVPLQGRSAVLARLDATLEAAERSQGTVLLCLGSAGMGKSAILAEASRRAHGRGFRVVEVRTVARDTPVPYDLVRQLVHDLAGMSDKAPNDFAKSGLPLWLVKKDSAGLVSGFPTVGVLPDDGASLERRILKLLDLERALVDLARQLFHLHLGDVVLSQSQSAPLLLAFDDLQNADRESLEFLRNFASDLGHRRVVLLATLDPDAVGGGPRGAAIGGLRTGPNLESISLVPLIYDETVETLKSLDPSIPPSPEYAQAIFDRAKGVPLAIGQWHRRWKGTAPAAGAASGEEEDSGHPEFRREGLSEETLRMLAYAAVIGRQFDLPALGRTLHRRSSDAIEPLLAPLVDNGTLLRRGPRRYEFARPSVRKELYTQLSESRRRLMHRNVARALEVGEDRAGPELFEVAWHYHLAGEAGSAVEYNRRAADVAIRQYAYEEARLYLERTLHHLHKGSSPSSEVERAVRVVLGHVLCRLGRVSEAVEVLGALENPPPGTAGASGALEHLFLTEVRPDLWAHANSAKAVAERALRAYRIKEMPPWLAMAHRALGVAAWSLADSSIAEEHHRAAAEIARQVGDARLEGRSLLDRAHLLRMLDPDGLALSQRLLTEAIERFAASGDLEWQARAHLARSAVLRSVGRSAEALADLTAAGDQAERAGSPALRVWVELQTARVLVEEGRTGRARKALERLGRLAGTPPRREVEQQLTLVEGMLQEREGRADKARALYVRSLSLATEAAAPSQAADMHRLLAELEEKQGRPEEARHHLDEAERLSAIAGMSPGASTSR